MVPLPAPEPSNHPVDVGLRSEAAIVQWFVRHRYRVLLPYGTNQRYDLGLDKLYAVPVEAAPSIECFLRVDPTANNQSRKIRWAADFELPA